MNDNDEGKDLMDVEYYPESFVAASMFYTIFHILINAILLLYDNDMRIQLFDGEYRYAAGYFLLTTISACMYARARLRPGYIKEERTGEELNRDVREYEKYFGGENRIGSEVQVRGQVEDEEDKLNRIEGENKQMELMEEEENSGWGLRKSRDQMNDLETKRSRKISLADETEEEPVPPLHFCNSCKIVQRYRTRHCKTCQTCVAKFDHHCMFIGGCIGELNHRKFWLMLLCMIFQFFWAHYYVLSIPNSRYGLVSLTTHLTTKKITG